LGLALDDVLGHPQANHKHYARAFAHATARVPFSRVLDSAV